MDKTVIVEPGQCLEDIALQEYGSIDGVTALVEDNLDLFPDGYSTDLAAGTELLVLRPPVDQPMYDAMRRLRVVPATNTADPGLYPAGDFNDDFSYDMNSD
jgi:hypothetical protein